MKNKFYKFGLLGVAALALVATCRIGLALASGVPQTDTLVYSGTLMNNGQPDSASHFIILKLWTGGTTAACSTIPSGNTQLTNGRFSIPFDPSCVAVIHQNQDVKVEVVIDGTSMGKTALTAVPYALEADTASNPAPGSAIAALVPAGTINAYGGVVSATVSAPPGWLLCDGSAVSRTAYAALFASIGTSWGGGDGATTFNLPDLRGRFLRGVDKGAGNDPDAATRAQMAGGGNSGDAVGTMEAAQFARHSHGGVTQGVANGGYNAARDYSGGAGASCSGFSYVAETNCGTYFSEHTHGITAEGGSETRPLNAAVNYIIKF